MTSPEDSGYALNQSDFGFTFASEFDLFPNPHRYTDAQGLSIIDQLLTIDDVSFDDRVNVVRDILGLSSIRMDGYCLQPMFRIVPGFMSKTSMLHGNDRIESGSGDDLVVGDDIRGECLLSNLISFQTR